jgi:hypothetical protein
MGFFIISHSQERMTDMQPENPHCFHRAGRAFGEQASSGLRSLDSCTTQALHLLRINAEELALELAVRLRVLGKSLAAGCPGQRSIGDKSAQCSSAYQGLRRQLDGFLGSLVDSDCAGQRYLPVIRHYLHNALPPELHGCVGGDACRINRVEAVISLLSDNFYENDVFMEDPVLSFSL